MKKSFNKLLVAAVSLFVALGVAAGTTFAWFTMNNTVTVTGIEVNTQVTTNLFIADDNTPGLGSTAIRNENEFGSSVNHSPAVVNRLEPVSTTDGKHFFYTTSALADGSKELGGYTQYNYTADPASGNYSEVVTDEALEAFRDAYTGIYGGVHGVRPETAVGYVDFVYQLKAINTDPVNTKDIVITRLDLVYNDDPWAAYESRAYRVAVFAQKAADHDNNPENKDTFTADSGNLVGIYGPELAENHGNTAVHPSGVKAAVDNYNADAEVVATVSARSTEYFKVVVRLYLEGEDTSCTNDTYLLLDNNWSLSMRFEFDSLNDAVSNLGPLYIEAESVSSAGATFANDTETYYKITGTDYYTNADHDKFYKVVPVDDDNDDSTPDVNYIDELLGTVAFRYSTVYLANKAVAANAIGDGYYEVIDTVYYMNTATYQDGTTKFYTEDSGVYTEVVNPVTFTMVKVKVTNNNVDADATTVGGEDYYKVGDTNYYIDTPTYEDGTSNFFVLDTVNGTATEVEVDAAFEIETVYLLNRTILTGDGNTVTTATGTYYKVSGSEYYVDTDTYVPGTTKFYTISGEPGSQVATEYPYEIVFTIDQ